MLLVLGLTYKEECGKLELTRSGRKKDSHRGKPRGIDERRRDEKGGILCRLTWKREEVRVGRLYDLAVSVSDRTI